MTLVACSELTFACWTCTLFARIKYLTIKTLFQVTFRAQTIASQLSQLVNSRLWASLF